MISQKQSAIGIIFLSSEGCEKALELYQKLDNSALFAPSALKNSMASAARDAYQSVYFYSSGGGELQEIIRIAFQSYSRILILGAVGIAVRLLSPYLTNKYNDPGVVVVDREGKYAVSLVSGHLGGANRLAKQVSDLIQAEPVITTGSDRLGRMTPDLLSSMWNLQMETISGTERQEIGQVLKEINKQIVADKPVKWLIDENLVDDSNEDLGDKFTPDHHEFSNISGVSHNDFHSDISYPEFIPWNGCEENLKQTLSQARSTGEAVILLSDREVSHIWRDNYNSAFASGSLLMEKFLLLRPRSIVVGVGCRRGVKLEELLSTLDEVFSQNSLSPLSLRGIASVDRKKSEFALLELIRLLDVPGKFYSPDHLQSYQAGSDSSTFVNQTIGVGNVCETAAKMFTGQTKQLIMKKTPYQDITMAVVRAGWPQWASVPELESV